MEDPTHSTCLAATLVSEGLAAVAVHTGEQAAEEVRRCAPEVILVDLNLPDTDGVELMRRLKKLDPAASVVIMNDSPDVREAVRVVRDGACDFLVKPFTTEDLLCACQRAVEDRCAKGPGSEITGLLSGPPALSELMGPSDQVRRLQDQIDRVAPTDFTVIICGETGTGKEIVARAIHERSRRARGPFIALDCGSLPETLVESELFGHEKGAFTGAGELKPGKLELACGGTVFLDEIGNLPLSMQAKLLRALQEREVYRLGGQRPVRIDARILTATNGCLGSMAAGDSFRQDLYHRLNEFTVEIPALRERPEDLLVLSKRFLDETNAELGKAVQGFSEKALELILSHNWPGNCRELRNAIRRAVLLARATIEPEHLGGIRSGRDPSGGDGSTTRFALGKGFNLHAAVRESARRLERAIILEVLNYTGGNKAKAARILGIDYKTLHVKLKAYGLPFSGLTTQADAGAPGPEAAHG
ncbi:MAG: sigma-54-dependent Fis family transcriptional regulator [Planctomycetes bacterium]|nr:sigma-54-dependent Fis family transcriptional regulator [Planctomycetota bacterium]